MKKVVFATIAVTILCFAVGMISRAENNGPTTVPAQPCTIDPDCEAGAQAIRGETFVGHQL